MNISVASNTSVWISKDRIQLATAVSCSMVIAGLYTIPFFRVLASIGQICLALSAIMYLLTHRQVGQRQKWHVYLGFVIIYLMHFGAGLITNSGNSKEYWRDLVLQLPFLVLPLAFWVLPPLPVKYLSRLYKLLLGLTTLSAVGSTFYYLQHSEAINELYTRSKVMPTVPDHIRFSLLVALSIAVGAVLLNREALRGWRRGVVLGITVFLAGYLHLLAVRSGLLALYVLGVVAIGYLLWRRAWRKALVLAVTLVVLPIASYFLLPTFYNKYHNTRDDASRVDQTHSANSYSLVGRVYSYQTAISVWRDNPVFGVGKADLQDEMSHYYRRHFPQIDDEHHIQPHNQFLFYLVSFGGLGVLVFALAFYFPLWWSRHRHAPLLISQYIIVTLSFLVEPTLETQTGLTFALFFLLLPLSSVTNDGREEVIKKGLEWRPA
ncbi:O-antigen ligase family protein [Hymenobacter latericus]|uniref:O-antigen ligase family protein n=1 Tax=Hymenobacter sp. YIM 151858-1 TaxID=2987688 RepID=UPI002226FC74|nr:O-antigen ligase family protein [Hymenobacter sp. YIM 151858-1]UYZ58896.1 O-antigen ligase family protein [Hymenobacter sp. YIM 151858-1]